MYNKKKKLQRAHELANEKRQALKRLGYDTSGLSDSFLRKVLLNDIRDNNKQELKKIPKKSRKKKPLTTDQRLKKNQSAKNLHRKKQMLLMEIGIDVEKLTVSNLRKVRLKDIESGNIKPNNYPFLFSTAHRKNGKNKFDFDFSKVYHFPDGKGWLIMWLDYSGEMSLNELMMSYNFMMDEQLIENLKDILNTMPTYSKEIKDSTSSGIAGKFISVKTSQSNARYIINTENENVRKNLKKKRYHKGVNKFWQHLGEDGKDIITTLTGHECLVILCSIFNNITEDSREEYEGVYKMLTFTFPDFKKFLPCKKGGHYE